MQDCGGGTWQENNYTGEAHPPAACQCSRKDLIPPTHSSFLKWILWFFTSELCGCFLQGSLDGAEHTLRDGTDRSGVPSSLSPSHSQVTPSFKPHKELTRGAFPICSPAVRGGITKGKSRKGQNPLTPGEGEMAQQVCRVEKREQQGLQDNWHSMPPSHIKQWGVIQRKSLTHCVTPWLPAGGTPHSSQGCHNSSRSQQVPAAVLSHPTNQFSSPHLCCIFKTAQKRSHPTNSASATITSPQILHLPSQLSLELQFQLTAMSGEKNTVFSREGTGLQRLTPLIQCLDYGSMDLLCELSRCLCLTFELGAIKISKAETTIKHQSLQSQNLPIWALLFPCGSRKVRTLGVADRMTSLLEQIKQCLFLPSRAWWHFPVL